ALAHYVAQSGPGWAVGYPAALPAGPGPQPDGARISNPLVCRCFSTCRYRPKGPASECAVSYSLGLVGGSDAPARWTTSVSPSTARTTTRSPASAPESHLAFQIVPWTRACPSG